MNDALPGGKVWTHPCQVDDGRRQLAGGRIIDAAILCWSRSLARENQVYFQRLTFDDHALDMPFDQVTIRNGDQVLRVTK